MTGGKMVEEHAQERENPFQRARQRLDEFRAVVEGGFVKTPAEKREILKQRAVDLARSTAKEDEGAMIEIVTFQLAHELYAIESHYIAEVYPLITLTPIPCTPPFVLGVVNLRGLIISVIDLKIFFELPNQGITNMNRLIILENKEIIFGILADRIQGAITMPVAAMQPSLPTLTDIRSQYLKGVTKERLIILDGHQLLSDSKIIVQ